MGLLKKKPPADAEKEAEEVAVKKSNKKAKNRIVVKFRETAWDAVQKDLIDGNYGFYDGVDYFAVMLTEEILQQVPPKDEILGSLITLVNRGEIKALITPETKENDYIVLLLDRVSIGLLEEHPFVWESMMEVIKIGNDGELSPMDNKTTLSELLDIAERKGLMNTKAQPENTADVDSDNESDDDEANFEGKFVEDFPEDMYEEPDEGMYDDDDDYVSNDGYNYDDDDEVALDDIAMSEPLSNDVPERDMSEDDYMDDDDDDNYDSKFEKELAEFDIVDSVNNDELDEFNNNDVVEAPSIPEPTQEAVEEIVTRVFSQGDLNLAVDAWQFDAQFPRMEFVPFHESRVPVKGSDGYLEAHLNYMSAQANAGLRTYHASNIRSLREKYIGLMSDSCAYIISRLDIDNTSETIGKRYKGMQEVRGQKYQQYQAVMRDQIDALNRDWQAKVEEAAEAGAVAARQQYKARYGRMHEDSIAQVEERLKREIESRFQEAVSGLHDDRRREAIKLYDIAQSQVFQSIVGDYNEIINNEKAMRERYAKELEDFIKSSYTDEKIRIEVLEREMNQKHEAARVREEYESKLSALEQELKRRIEASAVTERDLLSKISETAKAKDDYYAARIHALEAKELGFDAEIKKVRDECMALKQASEEKFAKQAEAYQNTIAVLKEQVDTEAESGRKHGRLIAVIIAAIAIASVAIGIVIGSYVRIERSLDLFPWLRPQVIVRPVE